MLINAVLLIATGMQQIDIQCMAIIHAMGSAGGSMADDLWITGYPVEDRTDCKRASSTIHVERSDNP